jgi:DNA-binding GntR family transcriptional regulator/AcrR family transcriptional regulator
MRLAKMIDSEDARTRRGRILPALRDMVLKGLLPSETRIEEAELSRELGASRRVLRSALESLASEGLVEPRVSGGYAARHFTIDDVRDAILARSTMEGLAASLAASRFIDPSELAPLRRLNAELSQAIARLPSGLPSAEQMSRFGDLNAAFHRGIVELARSPMLLWYIERIQKVAFASPGAVVLPVQGGSASGIVEEHEAILNAIGSRNAALAEQLVRKHGGLAIHAIESALNGRPHAGRNIALHLVGNKPRKTAGCRQSVPPKSGKQFSGATSERILDAAAELFHDKGFRATTTRELANRLNVQQGSLYHHISKKEDLLYRICSETMDCFNLEIRTAVQKAKGARERIGAFIRAELETTLQHLHRTLAMATEFRALSRPWFNEITRKHSEYSQMLEAELVSARASGDLRLDISTRQIRLALLNVLHWSPRWVRSGGALSLAELSSIHERVFWEGVIDPRCSSTFAVRPLPPVSQQRQRPHKGTLEKFVRGAAELFARNGYESTSTRSLATLVGMEKATLYYHIKGKEDLLYLICKSSIEQLTNDVNAAIDGIPDPQEQLQVWIQAHIVSLLRDQTQHATALAEARSASPERLTEIIGMRKAYQSRVRSLIEAGQKAGRIRPDIEAKYLGLMLEGMLDRTVIWYRRGGELSPVEIAAIFNNLFLTGAQRR